MPDEKSGFATLLHHSLHWREKVREKSAMEEGSEQTKRHSKIMLCDLQNFCFHRPMNEVLPILRDEDGSNGVNIGFHKFVYCLKNREWLEAAKVAYVIRINNPNATGRNLEMLQSISEFQHKLSSLLR